MTRFVGWNHTRWAWSLRFESFCCSQQPVDALLNQTVIYESHPFHVVRALFDSFYRIECHSMDTGTMYSFFIVHNRKIHSKGVFGSILKLTFMMISFGALFICNGLFSFDTFDCNRCDASLDDFDLFMRFFFFFLLQCSNSRVPQTARRPSQNSQSCRMETSRDIRRCWRRTESTSSISSNSCTTISSKTTSKRREGTKRATSNQSPSRILQITKTSIMMLTLKTMEMKWRWTMTTIIQWTDQVSREKTTDQAMVESARNANDEFCSRKHKRLSWSDDSVSNDTCRHQNENISRHWFDWHQLKSKSGSRTIGTRRNVQRTRREWIIISSTIRTWTQRFHHQDESLCQF